MLSIKENNMPKTAAAILCFCALSAILPAPLAAQSGDEPILYVTCTESGKSGKTSYQTQGDAILRLCTSWEGQMGGMPSTKLYKLRRSVKGLKVGERLQFYSATITGNGKDSSGYTADMVSIGDGLTKTVVKGRPMPTRPIKTYVFEDKPQQPPASTYSAAEIVRTDKGAVLRLKDLYGPITGGEGYFYGVCSGNAEFNQEQRKNFLTFPISEAELDRWDNLNKSQSGSARGPDGQGSWNYSVNVTAKVPDLGEVAVEVEGYDDWIPEANIDDETKSGNEIHVRAWVCKTGEPKTPLDQTATITFELEKVGREKGVCANWPTEPGQSVNYPDLRILENKNPDLEQINLYEEAKTRKRVKEAKLVLSSFDYGAWCILKVKAEDKDGNPIKVIYPQRKDSTNISIPKDEDHNRIADAWQKQNGVTGLGADWDEATVPNQDIKGDGLSLYQKYRGFVVATAGGKEYIRLKPREKAHFVIDPQGIFDVDRWWSASSIRAYKVPAKWTKDRQVDINRGFAGLNGKWATKIIEDATAVDESAPAAELKNIRANWGNSEGLGNNSGWTPKEVDVCRVFSGRIRYNLRCLREEMIQWLKTPGAVDREKADWLKTTGLPKDELISRLEGVSDSDLEPLVRLCVALTAIHECAHTCGVNGHPGDSGGEAVVPKNKVPDCPMQYLNWQDKYKLILFGEIGGQGKFCDADPQRCWRHLTTKD
jgi:hypothetical protein